MTHVRYGFHISNIPTTTQDTYMIKTLVYILVPCASELGAIQKRYKHYAWARPVVMKYQNVTFENAFWKQMLELQEEWVTCDFVGVMGSKAYRKIDLARAHNMIISGKHAHLQYYHFKNTDIPVERHKTTGAHPNMRRIWTEVLSKLNLCTTSAAFCNYFMCTPTLMLKFINWMEGECIQAVMEHPLIMTDAKHGGTLSTEQLVALCGVPYYPHVPFVLERIAKCFFERELGTRLSASDIAIT